MTRKIYEYIIIGIIFTLIGFILGMWFMYNFYSSDSLLDTLFNFTLLDVVGIFVEIFIGYLVYRYTKKDTREDKINDKRIELLEKINNSVELKLDNLLILSRDNFKIAIQEISNHSRILKSLCEKSQYENKVNYIDKYIIELEVFIDSELEEIQMSALYDNSTRKDKIENLINNIKVKCQETIVDIYKA